MTPSAAAALPSLLSPSILSPGTAQAQAQAQAQAAQYLLFQHTTEDREHGKRCRSRVNLAEQLLIIFHPLNIAAVSLQCRSLPHTGHVRMTIVSSINFAEGDFLPSFYITCV